MTNDPFTPPPGRPDLVKHSGQPREAFEYPPLESSADPYGVRGYPTDYPTYQPPGHQNPYAAPVPPAYPPPQFAPPQFAPPVYPGYPVGYPPPVGAYPVDPYDPYRPHKPPGTNPMAIGALVSSLISPLLCLLPSAVGLILGLLALQETKRTGQEGEGMALAAAILGGIGTVLLVLFLVVAVAGA